MSVNVSYMDGMGLHLSLYISRSHFLPSALQMHQLHPITKRESRGCFFVVAQVMLEENVYFHKFPFQYPCSLTMGIGCATKTFDMFSNSQTLAWTMGMPKTLLLPKANLEQPLLSAIWNTGSTLACPPSQYQWQMKVYRDPLLENIVILVVIGILGRGGNPRNTMSIHMWIPKKRLSQHRARSSYIWWIIFLTESL